MEVVERVGVAALTAVRLLEAGSPGQMSIALVLLEAAAEATMRRRAQQEEWSPKFADFYRGIGEPVSEIDLRHTLPVSKLTTKAWELDDRSRRAMEKTFEGLTDYLVFLEVIPPDLKAPLMRLHEYRNETYHHNRVRSETLRTAVQLYLNLVAELLELATPNMYELFSRQRAAALAAVLEIDTDEARGAVTAQKALAAKLRAAAGKSDALPRLLAEDVHRRLDDVAEALSFSASVMPQEGVTANDVSRLAQWTGNPLESMESLRGKRFPVMKATVARWRQDAGAISEATDVRAAFTLFASFEDEFEDYEAAVAEMASMADDYVQHQIDERRGK